MCLKKKSSLNLLYFVMSFFFLGNLFVLKLKFGDVFLEMIFPFLPSLISSLIFFGIFFWTIDDKLLRCYCFLKFVLLGIAVLNWFNFNLMVLGWRKIEVFEGVIFVYIFLMAVFYMLFLHSFEGKRCC